MQDASISDQQNQLTQAESNITNLQQHAERAAALAEDILQLEQNLATSGAHAETQRMALQHSQAEARTEAARAEVKSRLCMSTWN